MKVKRTRTKDCDGCHSSASKLFRVKIAKEGDWVFICETCLPNVKTNNANYQYGGTWKSKKRH